VLSLFDDLFNDPVRFLEDALYRIPAVLIALVLHEWAHGYIAYRMGDPTARAMGRLTLNPLKHLDPLGTLMMFFVKVGWAKPVPVNPNYFKNPHRDDFFVSIAGITMNLCLFLLFTLLSVVLSNALWHPDVFREQTSLSMALNYFLSYPETVRIHTFPEILREMLGVKGRVLNYILAGYGPELDVLFRNPGMLWAVRMTSQIAITNLFIAIFNLLPVPPLDGFHVVNDLVLKGKLFASRQVASMGMAAVLILSFTGVLGKVLVFLADGVQSGVLHVIAALVGG